MENSKVEELLNELYSMIQDARSVPLSQEKCIIEREHALDLMEEIMGKWPTEVRDAQSGQVLGKIADIMNLPANNVYVVRGGKKEHMIPAVDEFVVETNVDEGYLRVRLIEGM